MPMEKGKKILCWKQINKTKAIKEKKKKKEVLAEYFQFLPIFFPISAKKKDSFPGNDNFWAVEKSFELSLKIFFFFLLLYENNFWLFYEYFFFALCFLLSTLIF